MCRLRLIASCEHKIVASEIFNISFGPKTLISRETYRINFRHWVSFKSVSWLKFEKLISWLKLILFWSLYRLSSDTWLHVFTEEIALIHAWWILLPIKLVMKSECVRLKGGLKLSIKKPHIISTKLANKIFFHLSKKRVTFFKNYNIGFVNLKLL